MAKSANKSKRRASSNASGGYGSTQSSIRNAPQPTERTPLGSSPGGSLKAKRKAGDDPQPGPSHVGAPNVHFASTSAQRDSGFYESDTFEDFDDDWAHDLPSDSSNSKKGSRSKKINTTTPPNGLNGYLVPNTSSVARDHLALERTFLSYVRSTLGIAGAGVALIQLLTVKGYYLPSDPTNPDHQRWNKIDKYARPLGAVVVAFSLVVLGLGTSRFFNAQHSLLKHGLFPVGRFAITFIAAGLAVLVTVVFAVILVTSRVGWSS